MAEKTMLFTTSMLDCSKEEVKGVYPYPFKIVSDVELQKAILEGAEGNMVLDVIWSDKKFRWSLMAFGLDEFIPLVDARFLEAKPNFIKKNFDQTNQYLGVQKGKKKLNAAAIKAVSSEIKKALAK